MEQHEVYVGSVQAGNSGQVLDTRKLVKFEGEQLASYFEPGTHRGQVTDTRGVNQLLYRAADGRLIVFEENWSHWQNEPTSSTLLVIGLDDLGPMGRFAGLGAAAGDEFTRALTLDEGLTQPSDLADLEPVTAFLAGDVLEAGCIVTDPATVEEMASGEAGL